MDYIARAAITTCNNRKFKIFTSKQCLFGTLLMFFLASNGWAFETNVDSKVTANFAVTGALDVTGALKAGSVDPQAVQLLLASLILTTIQPSQPLAQSKSMSMPRWRLHLEDIRKKYQPLVLTVVISLAR